MAPVVWGLDLAEIKWSKFKSGNMWSTQYHLRRTKFIVYQLAMISCVVSESLGTAVLSDYVDQQDDFSGRSRGRAVEHNDDFVAVASYNIFAGVFVATIFGAAFFFELFWPERKESGGVRIAWKACAVLACIFALGAAIAITVVVASRCAYVTGLGVDEASGLIASAGGLPLCYKHSARAVASVVFAWLGVPFVIASTIVMWISHNHDEISGPLSTHAQKQEQVQSDIPVNQYYRPEGAEEPVNQYYRPEGPEAPVNQYCTFDENGEVGFSVPNTSAYRTARIEDTILR